MDRIDDYEPGRSVRGQKLTSRIEDYWIQTDRELFMPPWLVLEAICQAGAWLVVLSTEGRRRAALASVGEVRFGSRVRPGDAVHLEATIDSMDEEALVFHGRALVEGEVVAEAGEVICTLLEAERLEAAESTALMAQLLDRWHAQ